MKIIFDDSVHGNNGQTRCMGCMQLRPAGSDVCPYCGYSPDQEQRELFHLAPGTILQNRYTVGRVVGYGSFGVTYVGWDSHQQRKVAIKEYLPSDSATRIQNRTELIVVSGEKAQKQFEDGLRRFTEEGRKLAKVGDIPGVVYMYDCFEENHTAYIVTEFLDGITLEDYLQNHNRFTENETMDLMIPLIESLQVLHEKGIIHRDIAPDNIMLIRDSHGNMQAKLIDFGAAKFAAQLHSSKSLTVVVKAGYSPEEQYHSHSEQGPFTDVYALAAVMYRMVTGIVPPDSFVRHSILERGKKDTLVEPGEYNDSLSKNFEIAVMNALNVPIKDRTESMEMFEDELVSYEPVKRKGYTGRKIDFMRWPLWAKITVPIAGVAAIALLITAILWQFNLISSDYDLPEGMVLVTDFVNWNLDEAQAYAEDESNEVYLVLQQSAASYSPGIAENMILEQDLPKGSVQPQNTVLNVTVSTGSETYAMPDVLGMSLEDAQKILNPMQLTLDTEYADADGIAEGCIIAQSTEPNADITTGDILTLTVASSGSGSEGEVPALTGMTYEEALAAAAQAGKVLQVSEYYFSDDVTDNTVQEQEDAGSGKILVKVARNTRTFHMPGLSYRTEEDSLQLLANIGITPEVSEETNEMVAKGIVTLQSIEKETEVVPFTDVTITVSKGSTPFAMPDLSGKTEEEARQILQENSLAINLLYEYSDSVAEGSVISQSITSGTEVTRGETIDVTICSKEGMVDVPDVTGKTLEEATALLEDAGLKVYSAEIESSNDQKGLVLDQNPAAATVQPKGNTVSLNVGGGVPSVTVTSAVGKSQADAVSALKKAGFKVTVKTKETTEANAGKVLSQSPESGSLDKGSTVTITVGTYTAKETTPSSSSQKSEEQTQKASETPKQTTVAVSSVSLSSSSLTLTVNESSQLSATVSPSDATDQSVSWSSSDSSVAEVDKYGTVIANKAGSATITASCGGKSATCKVTVNKKINSYTVSWNDASGADISVSRTSSPSKGASTGSLSNGATIYDDDVLSISYSAKSGYTLTSSGKTSITVSGNVTSSDIYAQAQAQTVTYNIKYVSSNGTSLGSDTVTGNIGDTQSVSAPSKSGYDTPGSQSVTFASGGGTITFTYSPSSVSSSQSMSSGNWYKWTDSNGTFGITYSATAEYKNRTANSVQIRINWTNTLTKNTYYGFAQYFTGNIGGTSTGQVTICTNSTWATSSFTGGYSSSAVSQSASSGWVTVSVGTDATSVSVSASFSDKNGQSGSWSNSIKIPAY